LWFVYSVRSSRHREPESTVTSRSQLVANSTQSVTPQRQFCTSVEPSDIQPAPTASRNVSRNMRRYSGAEFTATSSQQDCGNSVSHQMLDVGDRRPFTGPADSVGVSARLSDEDYHSPDSAYHSSHGSGNSSAWNGGQGFDSRLPNHQLWPPVSGGPTYSKNHEKYPSWPDTQTSVLPSAVGCRASSWTDNARTNNPEVYNQDPVELNTQGEDGLQPSPREARRYFEEVAARLREQQSRSEFQPTRSATAFHPSNYAIGYQDNPYRENSSTSFVSAGKVDSGWVRSFQSPGSQECSPGPPPLPDTSPPHDPPPQYSSSSGTRIMSSSGVDKLSTPYNASSPRDVLDAERDRQSLTPSGTGVFGMQAPVSMSRIESFSKTSSQPRPEQSYLAHGRRYSYESGSGKVAAEGSRRSDKLSPRAVDEDELRSRLDKLPANQSQTSVLRRLSQEYFGASRSRYGINPPGRMSLGSISSCLSASGNDISEPSAVRNSDTNYRQLESESPAGAPGLSVPGLMEPADDGANFVRSRKTQMSLRKAFGILDDFDVAEIDALKQLPVLTEVDVPHAILPSTVRHGSDALPTRENHRVSVSKGRRSSESEFHRDLRNFDRLTEKPAVDSSSVIMQRSMSLGSALQPMVSSSHRLSTASDAHSSHSSSSGSTNGVRSSLDYSTGSSARSAEILSSYGVVSKESGGDPVKLAKAKSKSLPRDVLLSSDPGPAMSVLQPWHQSERMEVSCSS